jgi:hypothetical protein
MIVAGPPDWPSETLPSPVLARILNEPRACSSGRGVLEEDYYSRVGIAAPTAVLAFHLASLIDMPRSSLTRGTYLLSAPCGRPHATRKRLPDDQRPTEVKPPTDQTKVESNLLEMRLNRPRRPGRPRRLVTLAHPSRTPTGGQYIIRSRTKRGL